VLVTYFSLDKTVSVHPGTNLLLLHDGTINGTLQHHDLAPQLLEAARQALMSRESSTVSYVHESKTFTAFIEFIRPAISLIIVGAGNDAMPVVETAKILGWKVTVADGRPAYASAQRFPQADQVLLSRAEQLPAQLFVDEETAIVLMTHNYNYDFAILRQLINSDIRYLGMLGPRKRLDSMLKELRDQHIYTSDADPDNVYGPVGLDIAAETAEEIAIAITAEVKAVMAGTKGQSLRTRQQPIHQRGMPAGKH
jgi:xanthine/CO dehydrogenase XdhC/CoxF family maturation factor